MADKVQTTGEVLLSRVGEAQKVLVGLGAEWNGRAGEDLKPAYEALAKLLAGKDYFIVTVNVDGEIFHSSLDGERITAPCGNLHWFQCQAACTADIWEEGEVPEGRMSPLRRPPHPQHRGGGALHRGGLSHQLAQIHRLAGPDPEPKAGGAGAGGGDAHAGAAGDPLAPGEDRIF